MAAAMAGLPARPTRRSIDTGRRGDEVAHRGNGAVGVESLVLAIGESHKSLGGADRRIK